MPQIAGSFDAYLDQAVALDARLGAAARVLRAIAAAAIEMSGLIGLGRLYGQLGASRGSTNTDGDVQKELDVLANDMFVGRVQAGSGCGGCLRGNERAIGSRFRGHARGCDGSARRLLEYRRQCFDRHDLFDSSRACRRERRRGPFPATWADADRRRFCHLWAADVDRLRFGRAGQTQIFTLDRRDGRFYQAVSAPVIARESAEYAINASNYRHWEAPVRAFIDDCEQGTEGPLKHDHNMRWTGSLVADTYRILLRGGIFLYPGDQRAGYNHGRLRLLYEANPIAFIVERAAGIATDGVHPILDIVPSAIHARVPLVFGSAGPVELVARYHSDPQFSVRAPLFGKRGLMRP